METKKCHSFFFYNKDNELIKYVDLNEFGEIENYYKLDGRTLTKINKEPFLEKRKTVYKAKKAVINFAEDCKLIHMNIEGDTWCKAVRKNSKTHESPKINTNIYMVEEEMKRFSIQSELINNWIKKL